VSKIRSMREAASLVSDGATIGVGGLSMNSAPMGFVRELVRSDVRDLTVVSIVGSMAVDWLVASGKVNKVVTGLVSFEGLGLAPNFRRAAEAGDIEVEEYSEHLLICQLQAAAHGLPFVPTKAGIGTDVLDLHPDTTRLETDRVTGELYVACTPLPIDVAVVHAHAADADGNTRVDPKLIWMDSDLVRAADATVVTVEAVVPRSSFTDAPARTTYPRFVTDAVVHAPWGAYPTSNYPSYTHHEAFFEEYLRASRERDRFSRFWEDRISAPEDQAGFLEANGGAATILAISRRAT